MLVHKVLGSIFHSRATRCLFRLKQKEGKTKSIRSLFPVSLAYPQDLNPDGDYFHVIGADVAPVAI